uniref:Uncharacterized protein n=1 Tax=Steinernema glaseri TaxID=37863 RepID=A0A1I7Z5L9_9BILA
MASGILSESECPRGGREEDLEPRGGDGNGNEMTECGVLRKAQKPLGHNTRKWVPMALKSEGGAELLPLEWERLCGYGDAIFAISPNGPSAPFLDLHHGDAPGSGCDVCAGFPTQHVRYVKQVIRQSEVNDSSQIPVCRA